MAGPSIQTVRDSVKNFTNNHVNNVSRIKGALARDVYRMYQNAQVKRFESSNASEGSPWRSLNTTYAARKRIKYASYPEAGRRTMIATGTLSKMAVGAAGTRAENPETSQRISHRHAATNRQLLVAVSGEYAGHANKERPFMDFGDTFWRLAKERIRLYFRKGA